MANHIIAQHQKCCLLCTNQARKESARPSSQDTSLLTNMAHKAYPIRIP
jgi:hypothetical protein